MLNRKMRKELKEKIKRILNEIVLYSKVLKAVKKGLPNSTKHRLNKYFGDKKGEKISDLIEISYEDVNDKSMLKYWRYHSTIKLYKSNTIKNIISFMLNSIVPGLTIRGKPVTYKMVFDEIQNLQWPADIFLMGGTIRDSLRREPPNDIDTAISCSPNDIKKICEKNKWKYHINTKYSYFMIGEKNGDEYLEGKDIYSSLKPLVKDEFCMNALFYDLRNNIIIDKTGKGIESALNHKLTFPVDELNWNEWMEPSKFFRFYKFRLRNYTATYKQKRFILTKFRQNIRNDFSFRGKILFKRLHTSKKELINIISDDIKKVFLFDEINDNIEWYKSYINNL